MKRHIAHSQRLLVVVGPSGAGKDTVLRHWRHRLPDGHVHFAQRVITRAADPNEAHESVSGDAFQRLLADDQLATWWQAHGLHYGIRWHELAPLAQGRWVVMNGSRAHLPTLRAQAPDLRCVEIGAAAEVRAQRLAQRAREDAADRTHRLERDVPTNAHLHLCNDHALDTTVETLHRWWQALPAD